MAIRQFIASDLRPISVVDGTGFLTLIQAAELWNAVPCCIKITSRIMYGMPDVTKMVLSQHAREEQFCIIAG